MSLIANIKKYIPRRLKYPLWFVFKADQRHLGAYTLRLDILGASVYGLQRLNPFVRLQPLSICIGVLNRSRNLLRLVEDLSQAHHADMIELSIFDCGSDDIPNLEQELRQRWQGNLVFTSQKMPFSRSYTFNRAVAQCSQNTILICDADFTIPPQVVKLCSRYTVGRTVWFPYYFYVYKYKPHTYHPSHGHWMLTEGRGIFACKKKYFEEIGGFDERYKVWGGEDDDIFYRFYKNGNWMFRSKAKFLHQWHPSLNPKYQQLEEIADRQHLASR